jgi:hypothetical protein
MERLKVKFSEEHEIELSTTCTQTITENYSNYIINNQLDLTTLEATTKEIILLKIFNYESNILTMLVDVDDLGGNTETINSYRNVMNKATRIAGKLKSSDYKQTEVLDSILEMNNFYNDLMNEEIKHNR